MEILDRRQCLAALRARDARFDGRFFTGVRTTGIYCRPICPARTPRAENVDFFACAAAAEAAGLRPCRRCRPETAPGSPAWIGSSATVARALREVADGALDREGVAALAARLQIGARHLSRLFERHVGASPVVIAQTRRVHFAKQLLEQTELPIGRIVWASGFGSVRRFQEVFRMSFGRAPGELRRALAAHGGSRPQVLPAATIELRLAYRPPLAWPSLLAFLAARSTPGVEGVDGEVYRRLARFGACAGVIEVAPHGRPGLLRLRVAAALAPHLLDVVARCRRLFDLDADPEAIQVALSGTARLRELVRARPGLRVPGCWDPLETAVRAILGQQVTVKGATTLMGRLVQRFGAPIGGGQGGPLQHRCPDASELAEAALESIGIPRARAAALRALARAALSVDSPLARAASLDEAVRRLEALDGIGPWTAQYIAMRVLGEPDAYPGGDLVLRRALAPADAEAARPWRAYAAMQVWTEAAEAAPERRTR